jgi:hypothetical protein
MRLRGGLKPILKATGREIMQPWALCFWLQQVALAAVRKYWRTEAIRKTFMFMPEETTPSIAQINAEVSKALCGTAVPASSQPGAARPWQ